MSQANLAAAIKKALSALNSAPQVGGVFDSLHRETHLAAFNDLSAAFKESGLEKVVENAKRLDEKRETLTDVGYDFREDSDQPGMWLWMAPSDNSDISYDSEAEAIEAAWNDAAEQTRGIRGLNEIAWTSICFAEKCNLVKQSLTEN